MADVSFSFHRRGSKRANGKTRKFDILLAYSADSQGKRHYAVGFGADTLLHRSQLAETLSSAIAVIEKEYNG